MSSRRKPVSKGTRFDIFHRDGFTCQYCGAKPPDVVLELDHVTAVANGGTNDESNLITSCSECNSGKSSKRLGDVKPSPDADLQYLKVQQQKAEYERYLVAAEERDAIQRVVVHRIWDVWTATFGIPDAPAESTVKGWLNRYHPQLIERAILDSLPAYQRGTISSYNGLEFAGMVKYVSAVLRNLCSEGF